MTQCQYLRPSRCYDCPDICARCHEPVDEEDCAHCQDTYDPDLAGDCDRDER